MKWLFLVCGIVLGAIGVESALTFLRLPEAVADQDDQIIFGEKVFYDSEAATIGGTATVTIAGTLTGPHLGYPNNTYNITCYRDQRQCIVASIEQIGHNQVGTMYAPLSYPIVEWSPDKIVAKYDAKLTGCYTTTITIDRRQKSALWVEEPVNQTEPFCKNTDTNINKYTIEDSPGWKRLNK
jgi:hypothetical protein